MANWEKTPLLQKAAWVASLASVLISLLVWLIPYAPSGVAATELPGGISPLKAITTIALLAFAAVAIAFGIRAGQERLTYRVRFSGDWSHSAIVFYGLLLSFSSFLFFAMGPKKETLGETVLLVSFLAAGLVMALSGLRHGYGGVRGKADLQGQSSRGMQITTSILIILGALAAILLVIIVGRALTG